MLFRSLGYTVSPSGLRVHLFGCGSAALRGGQSWRQRPSGGSLLLYDCTSISWTPHWPVECTGPLARKIKERVLLRDSSPKRGLLGRLLVRRGFRDRNGDAHAGGVCAILRVGDDPTRGAGGVSRSVISGSSTLWLIEITNSAQISESVRIFNVRRRPWVSKVCRTLPPSSPRC